MPNIINGDLVVGGNLSAQTMSIPQLSISDINIAEPPVGDGIDSYKVIHRQHYTVEQGAAASATIPICCVLGTEGAVIAFRAGAIAPPTSSGSVTIDLRKNGTSILTSVITLNSSSASRTMYSGSMPSNGCAIGDWFDVVITLVSGSASGLLVEAIIDESPT